MPNRAHLEEVEEQAALYALGSLVSGEAEQFRQRLAAGCSLCQGLFAEYRQIATAMAVAVPEVAPPEGLKTRLLERIGATAQPAPKKRRQRPILLRAEQNPWIDTPYPGVQTRELRGENTLMLKMAPESWFPAHDHKDAEECLILEGSVESDGITAFAGDYVYMPKGSHHAPLYSRTGCTMFLAYTAA